VATLQYGGIIERVATTATGSTGGTTTLTITSQQIQVFTGAANQIVKLPATNAFNEPGAKFEIYNESTGTLTIQDSSTAILATISPNASLVLKSSNPTGSPGVWLQLATSSGASSGAKNYLSPYTASTSSGTANTGNGNFESGSTNGWSLAHTSLSSLIPNSVATAGTPFSASAGGSAASGNLSITTVTAGTQIAGTYSGSLASSAASVAGDLLISSAFFIDKEDQAKVMQIKLYYQVATAGGLNFSGSSANGFAVYIYDVTNGAWIQPAGVYNFTQNSGTGYLTATFQTTSNSTQYQIALVNINASTGAYTMYLDDISVGPQIAPSGPAMTDWGNQAWTPTGSWVTNTTYTGKWRRVGDSMEADVFISLTGAPTATGLSINMPSGLSIDTTKVANSGVDSTIVGSGLVVQAGLSYPITVVEIASSTTIRVGTQTTVSGTNPQPITDAIVTNTVPITFASGATVAITFRVPIVGWSSNSSMSADTDTRVVAMQVQQAAPTATITASFSLLKFTSTPSADTHGGFSTSTGQYTVPVTGFYRCTASCQVTATFVLANQTTIAIGHNSTTSATISSEQTAGGAVGDQSGYISGTIYCLAGDTLNPLIASAGTSPTVSAIGSENFFHVERLTGPAVVAATESVNMRYTDTSGASIGTGYANYTYATKTYDSHNAYSGGVYTVPVSGKYHVSAGMTGAAVTLSTTNYFAIGIAKNGTLQSGNSTLGNGANNTYGVATSDTVSCVAGDTISIQVRSGAATTGSTGSISSNFGGNWVAIERVGN